MSPLTRILALALSAALALQVVNAQDLPDGKYVIVTSTFTAPPPRPIGADIQGPTSPVVVGGRHSVWTVKKSDQEKYEILLEQAGSGWLAQAGGNEVFVSSMSSPARWSVQKHEGGVYSIEVPSNIRPTRAWTLDKTLPGTKVTLENFETPKPGQLWRIIPIFDE